MKQKNNWGELPRQVLAWPAQAGALFLRSSSFTIHLSRNWLGVAAASTPIFNSELELAAFLLAIPHLPQQVSSCPGTNSRPAPNEFLILIASVLQARSPRLPAFDVRTESCEKAVIASASSCGAI